MELRKQRLVRHDRQLDRGLRVLRRDLREHQHHERSKLLERRPSRNSPTCCSKRGVPEIPKRPESEQSETLRRDRHSGSIQKPQVLSYSYRGNRQDAGSRSGCCSGHPCEEPQAQGQRARRWQQSTDGKWRARRLGVRSVNEQLDEMRRQDDRRVDEDRQVGLPPGLEPGGGTQQGRREVPLEAMPWGSRRNSPPLRGTPTSTR